LKQQRALIKRAASAFLTWHQKSVAMTSTGDDLSEFPGVKDLLQLWSNDPRMMMEDTSGDDFTPLSIDAYHPSLETTESMDDSCDVSRASQKRRRVSATSAQSSMYHATVSSAASSYRSRSREFIEDYGTFELLMYFVFSSEPNQYLQHSNLLLVR
jgi:hypothetical protein